jgi:ferrous iron transport protein A
MTTPLSHASPSHPPEDPDCVPLHALPVASRAEVVQLQGSRQATRRLTQLGIVVGAILQVRRSAPLGGPIMVEVRGSMVALSRRVAHRVLVRVLP